VPPGRTLRVNIDNGGIMFAQQKTKTGSASAQNKPATNTAVQSTVDSKGNVSYKVQSGDSLYAIAKKYPGLTAKKIQEANSLTTTNLRIGQVLIIPKI